MVVNWYQDSPDEDGLAIDRRGRSTLSPSVLPLADINVPAVRLALLTLVFLFPPICISACLAQEQPKVEAATHRLLLRDQSVAYGALLAGEELQHVSFLVKGFSSPFLFPPTHVVSVRKVLDGVAEKSNADNTNVEMSNRLATEVPSRWWFRFKDQQRLAAEIIAFDSGQISLKSEYLGQLTIPAESLLQIEQGLKLGKLIKHDFQVDQWKDPNGSKGWNLESGEAESRVAGSRLQSRFDLPSKCQMKLVVRWSNQPDFSLNIGVDTTRSAQPQQQFVVGNPGQAPISIGRHPSLFSVESWEDELMLVCEGPESAELISLGKPNDSQLELCFYIDQEQGVVVLHTVDDRLILVDFSAQKSVLAKIAAIEVQNFGAGLSVQNFELRQWNGDLPAKMLPDGEVWTHSAGILSCVITGWNSQTRRWELRAKTNESHNPNNSSEVEESKAGSLPTDAMEDTVGWIDFDNLRAGRVSSTEDQQVAGSPLLAVELVDGSRLLGELATTKDERMSPQPEARTLWLYSKLTADPIAIPIDAIQELKTLHLDSAPAVDSVAQPPSGDLSMVAVVEQTRIKGVLLASVPDNNHSVIRWKPNLSVNSSTLDNEIAGLLQTGESLNEQPRLNQEKETPRTRRNAGGNVARPIFGGLFGFGMVADQPEEVEKEPRQAERPKPSANKSEHYRIYFRSGDSAPAQISKVDTQGIQFSSDRTATTFAPNSQIDSIVFRASKSTKISAEQRQRLLTIPRAQRNDPPTHLLIATSGDYLRGHLVELDNDLLRMEVRGEMFEFPLKQVAELVWLYERDWKLPKEEAAESTVQATSSVKETSDQSIFVNWGIDQGMSLVPLKLADGFLTGNSPLLGESKIKLSEIKKIYFGPEIASRIEKRQDSQFSLKLAAMPREANGESGAMGSSGMHPLVGNPAPGLKLPNLADEWVNLQQLRGQIVVVDFWASWCGPCMQTMPLLENMLAELQSDQIRLLAVNLQESKSRIELALNRIKLSGEVLLDKDGEAALAYSANAIPQTVIIDRNGLVTHVFVGGGEEVVLQIQQALQGLLGQAPR